MRRAVNAVVVDVGVNRAMQFDTRHLRAAKLLFCQYVVDMIPVNLAERCAHAAADTGLFAVGDDVVAHDV